MQIVVVALYEILIVMILCVLSVYDIKYREIPVFGVVVGIFIGLLFRLCYKSEDINLIKMISDMFPGLILVFLSIYTKGIGLGDGLCLIISELGFYNDMAIGEILFLAICSIVVALIYIFRKKQNDYIPYVPIITLSHILTLSVGCYL